MKYIRICRGRNGKLEVNKREGKKRGKCEGRKNEVGKTKGRKA